MFTRHSVTLPWSSVTTLVSLTQAPLMFFTDSAHFFNPVRTASSMPVGEEALTSMILATVMAESSLCFSGGRPSRQHTPALLR